MTFGTYEQDCGADNGMESIKWFILDVEDGRATLLSVHLLDCQRYHPEEADVTWEDCALRAWLNDDFLNAAFTKAEQEYIAVTELINGDTPAFGTQGGNDTSDRIRLFSLEDLEKYFQISLEECMNVHENQSIFDYVDYFYDQDHRLMAKPTAYAIQQGCDFLDVDGSIAEIEGGMDSGPMMEEYLINLADLKRCRYADGCGFWWLRSSGAKQIYASSISDCGSISFNGIFVNAKRGVCSALTVTY